LYRFADISKTLEAHLTGRLVYAFGGYFTVLFFFFNSHPRPVE
jgi:hypothetical protein